MGLVRDRWSCPVCGRSGLLVKIDREVSYAIRGGSIYVCKRCAKHRRKEIEEHNAIYWGDHTRKKDPNCKHEWVHPYPGRWYCPKCSARSLKYMKRAFRQEVVHPRLTREAIDRRKRLYEKLKKALKASEKSVYTKRST